METFRERAEGFKHLDCKTINFSDTVIRLITFTEEQIRIKLSGGLLIEIMAIAYLQNSIIANKNIFIRGYIVFGEFYYSNDMFFGKALNKAYSLESEIAIFPRIIIDRELYDKISYAEEHVRENLPQFLSKDMDGLLGIIIIR